MIFPGVIGQQQLLTLGGGGGIDPNTGIVWTQRNAAEENEWFGVTWAPALSLFVAVASSGANRAMTSPDGISWTARSAPASTWRRVCWSPALNLFVAVADTGVYRLMTSPDGITWTGRGGMAGAAPFDVCWSPTLGKFVAIGITAPYVYYSSDGITWTAGTGLSTKTWVGVCWSESQGLFVAVGYNGAVATSTTGITWYMRTAPDANWTRVTWSAERSLFVAVAQTEVTNNIMTSPNGINWTLRESGLAQMLYSVTYANGLFVVAVSSDGSTISARILTSPDGVVWTPRGAQSASRFRDVVWSPALSKFVAVASSGTGNRVMTSL